MRLATVHLDGGLRAAVVVDDRVHLMPAGLTVLDLVRSGLAAAVEAGARAVSGAGLPLADVRLAPPLEPPSVRDFMAFEEHVEGALRTVAADAAVPQEWYDAPRFYFTNPAALVGAHDDVAVPPGCERLDFELEVAAVVGRDARDVAAADADAHLFGYAVLNDWSARDLQRPEMRVGLGPCKGKDFATTLGPWIVTADEVHSWRDADGTLPLEMVVAVGGVEVGRDRLSSMAWTFGELLSYASRGAPVRAGDVLGSGTCGGGGSLAELWGRGADVAPLQPGDVVTMTVEGLGTIANRVVAPTGGEPAVAPARRRVR
ncbi:MAG: Fumarylacetoacetase [Frankiales bacterium]|nr:Fumarylacetoacetase [Frankiales bacterium]